MSSGEDGGMLGLCSGNQCWTGGSGVQARPSTPPAPVWLLSRDPYPVRPSIWEGASF